jgi:hypothetical protein
VSRLRSMPIAAGCLLRPQPTSRVINCLSLLFDDVFQQVNSKIGLVRVDDQGGH